MWFKKKANISGYSPNTAYDGSDWRTNGGVKSWSVSQTLPSAADANNYFYLPTLGFYSYGQLYHVGNTGYYWSSSADSHHSSYAYDLHFGSGGVTVNSSRYRIHGFRVGGFE